VSGRENCSARTHTHSELCKHARLRDVPCVAGDAVQISQPAGGRRKPNWKMRGVQYLVEEWSSTQHPTGIGEGKPREDQIEHNSSVCFGRVGRFDLSYVCTTICVVSCDRLTWRSTDLVTDWRVGCRGLTDWQAGRGRCRLGVESTVS